MSSAHKDNEEKKVCIITGSNSGIGFEAAKKLAAKGYEVILACRNEERGKAAETKIRESDPGADVHFMALDLASLSSIHQFVKDFHSTGKPLHVLCNNAGVVPAIGTTGRSETEDGFELALGVGHLGHFLLTNLLLEDLKKTAEKSGEARIVVTTSEWHRSPLCDLSIENLMLTKENTYRGGRAYAHAKLANILFTYELSRRLRDTKITCNCLHPGIIANTGLFRNIGWLGRTLLWLASPLGRIFGYAKTVDYGGDMLSFLASDDTLKGVTGKYFMDFKEAVSSDLSYDSELALMLWKVSEDLVHLGK